MHQSCQCRMWYELQSQLPKYIKSTKSNATRLGCEVYCVTDSSWLPAHKKEKLHIMYVDYSNSLRFPLCHVKIYQGANKSV